MARKPNERIVFEWMEKHRTKIGEESFNRVVEVLRAENPGVLEPPRPPGRPRATDDPGSIVEGGMMNELDDFGMLTDIFNLFGNRGKDLARLAVCLMEIGFFRSENAKGKRFEETSKAIYNLICEYKEFPKNPISYQSFMIELNAIETEETSYPTEEREEDKRMMENVMEEVRAKCWEYYQDLLSEYGISDYLSGCGYDDYLSEYG